MLSVQPECALAGSGPGADLGNGSSSRFLDALGIGPEITGRVKLPPLSALETPIPAPASGPNAFFALAAQQDEDDASPLPGNYPTLDSLTLPASAAPILVPKPMTPPPAPTASKPLEPIIPTALVKETPKATSFATEPVKESLTPPPAPAPSPAIPAPAAPVAETPAVSAPEPPAPAPAATAPEPKLADVLHLGCPVCKADLTISTEYVGVQGSCPACQTPIVAYRETESSVRLMVLTAKPPMPTAPRQPTVPAAALKR